MTTPASEPTGPLFDALDAPLPSERDRAERSRARTNRERTAERAAASPTQRLPQSRRDAPARERTDVVPRGDWHPKEERRPQRPARPRPGTRRVRRTIKHIDPISVLKISAFFYAIFFVVWLILAAILYWFIQGLGLLDAVADVTGPQGFIGDGKPVEITLGYVERWAFVIGLVMILVGCIVNTVVAFLYNVASDLFGGVQVTFAERDS